VSAQLRAERSRRSPNRAQLVAAKRRSLFVYGMLTLEGNTIPAALQAQERILSSPLLLFLGSGDDAFLTGLSACMIRERGVEKRERRG